MSREKISERLTIGSDIFQTRMFHSLTLCLQFFVFSPLEGLEDVGPIHRFILLQHPETGYQSLTEVENLEVTGDVT